MKLRARGVRAQRDPHKRVSHRLGAPGGLDSRERRLVARGAHLLRLGASGGRCADVLCTTQWRRRAAQLRRRDTATCY